MSEDQKRRDRRRADKQSERDRYADERGHETRRSSARPTLTSQPHYEPSISARSDRRRDQSTDAVSGRKLSIRIDPDPQYPEPIKTPVTSPRHYRAGESPRIPRYDDQTGDWERPPKHRAEKVGSKSRGSREHETTQVSRRGTEIEDSYRGGGESSKLRSTDERDDREYGEWQEGERRGSRGKKREGGYFERVPGQIVHGDPGESSYRGTFRRDDSYEDDRTLQPSSHRRRRSSERHAISPTGRRPYDDSEKAPRESHSTRNDRDDRAYSGWQATLPTRGERRDSSQSGGDHLRKSSLKRAALNSNSYVQMSERDRIARLEQWRDAKMSFTEEFSEKLRTGLKTAFKNSMTDKDWGKEYKWSEYDAMEAYERGKEGRRDVCAHFRRTYGDTVDTIYDRFLKDPSKGLPSDVDPEVIAKVSPKTGREGLHIKSSYTIRMEGETETKDDFYLWFGSKRISDSFVSDIKTIGKVIKKAKDAF